MQTDESCHNLQAVVAQLRETKHDINNSLGVIMALAELSERKPESIVKLRSVVLERAPQMVAQLQKVSENLQKIANQNPNL